MTSGIDLGTSYATIGVWQDDAVTIIRRGACLPVDSSIPGCIAFTPTGHLVGDTAKKQIKINPHNTVYGFTGSPFNVIDQDGTPAVKVDHKGESRIYTVEELVAMVLSKAKIIAEAHLRRKVSGAVITVPSLWNSLQSSMVKDAATIARLNVLPMISAPTCAALQFGLALQEEAERNVLVCDLGGAHCDVSLLAIEAGVYEVKAVAGDTDLGGMDLCDTFSMCRLREGYEAAMSSLSAVSETTIELVSFFGGIDYRTTITRTKFIESVLRDSHIDKGSTHNIVLVGGSMRIPKIRKLVQDFFGGNRVCHIIRFFCF
ncbi:HSP70-domain-containing protein [Gonapodya prolifera JEL478]|uniref:HSP70-domain-containing protein n=1 Tax=Gonapodya prolifera (strain JEL478) TaxID=1344416 RepID=A0A139A457_GONPJ|nr:HSP70-domain-containing protein [Gonapodya prolifera JEL478]|eukprot:KXS11459.1 HSP70-domain-containing protein [Gonapodya prolifera JEL478]